MRYTTAWTILRLLVVAITFTGVGCRTDETPEQQVHDARTTANVKSKLAADLGASTVTNISVNVTNNVVTLSGMVHNSSEKSRAISIAQTVPEVTHVNDDLQIVAARVQP
jgi:osmotically-inducible protein OsmY